MKGHFFCAKVGEDSVFFVSFLEGGWDRKGHTRMFEIDCVHGKHTTGDSAELQEAAYSAWQRARHDIYEEWRFATDPANLQPRVRPALKKAADHIRKYPRPGMSQAQIDRLVESIEAPWAARIERQIRECAENLTTFEASAAIAGKVKELGLEPFKPADPLPPIDEDEIRLVCWIAADAAQQ